MRVYYRRDGGWSTEIKTVRPLGWIEKSPNHFVRNAVNRWRTWFNGQFVDETSLREVCGLHDMILPINGRMWADCREAFLVDDSDVAEIMEREVIATANSMAGVMVKALKSLGAPQVVLVVAALSNTSRKYPYTACRR